MDRVAVLLFYHSPLETSFVPFVDLLSVLLTFRSNFVSDPLLYTADMSGHPTNGTMPPTNMTSAIILLTLIIPSYPL